MSTRDATPQDILAIRDIWNEAIAEGASLYWSSPVTVERVSWLLSSEKALRLARIFHEGFEIFARWADSVGASRDTVAPPEADGYFRFSRSCS